MTRYLALVLALGGWVCHRDGDNPCLGANTCATDVGDACCPLDRTRYCGKCVNAPEECTQESYTCSDESTLLDCSFDAQLAAPTCTAAGDGQWRVQGTAMVRGCGGENVVVLIGGQPLGEGVACGAWLPGALGGCTPDGDAITETQLAIDVVVTGPPSFALTLARAHGSAPTIATVAVTCH